MVGYRIYRVSKEGHFVGVHEVVAASDAEAMLKAHELLDGLDVEVWRGNEKIGYLRASEGSPPNVRKKPSSGDHRDSA